MKSTGIIRRIDNLGRIVIPKEIRNNLRIKEGDNLEIFINDEDIIFKKYSVIKKINDLAQELTDAIYTFTKHNVLITDNDIVLAASGSLKKTYFKKPISNQIRKSIERREKILESYFKEIEIIDSKINCSYILSTLIVSSEAIGSIIIFSEEDKLTDVEFQLSNIVSAFITKYLEQ